MTAGRTRARRAGRVVAGAVILAALFGCATTDTAPTLSITTPPTTTPPITTPPIRTPPSTTPRTTGAPPAPTSTSTPPTTDPGVESTPVPGGGTAQILDFAFVPAVIEVPAGSTVTWSNDDSFDHSVVSDDVPFDSGTLAPGDEFVTTVSVAGEFSYFCGIHPFMTGTLVVSG